MRHCLIALMLLMGAQLAVGNETAAQNSPTTLKFNISPGGYPPYTIAYPDGTVSGIFWDALSIVARRLDFRLEPVEIPAKRSDDFLQRGHSDLTMRAVEWAANPDAFIFSDPVMMTRDAIFTHRDSTHKIHTINDLRGTLLTRLGFNYPWLADRVERGDVDIITVQSQRPMFKRLYQGGERFNGAVSNLYAGYWVLKNNPEWDAVIDEAPIQLEEVGFRLMFPPRHATIVPAINRELARLKESGELDRIINAYR